MSEISPGIDYGHGTTNRDTTTGIRYGVISIHALEEFAHEDFEDDYGPAMCGQCGNEASDTADGGEPEFDSTWTIGRGYEDYYCLKCRRVFDSSEAFGDEVVVSSRLDAGGYVGELGSDGDVFLIRSPYYTHAQFCSPCAPGAGHLANPCPTGPRTYCFGHDWFEGNRAPYPVYRVSDGSLVEPNPQ